MLGMGCGIALSSAIGDARGAAYCAYAITLSLVAACSYASLRGLRLATLNWARMRILLRGYMREGGTSVPGPREVNAREPMPSWQPGRRSTPAEWCVALHGLGLLPASRTPDMLRHRSFGLRLCPGRCPCATARR